MCPCWLLWLFVPLVFLVGFIHKPTGDRIRLWLARIIKRGHEWEMKVLTPRKYCEACNNTRQVIKSQRDGHKMFMACPSCTEEK